MQYYQPSSSGAMQTGQQYPQYVAAGYNAAPAVSQVSTAGLGGASKAVDQTKHHDGMWMF